MGATQNLQAPFPVPDNLTQDWLIPYALAGGAIPVSIADAMYFAGAATLGQGGNVAYPADQLASLGSEALDQAQFAALFVGYSQEKILSTETNPNKRFTVRVSGPVTAQCPSQVWNKGDLVGIFSNGVALNPQQVDKVSQRFLAIGVCIKDSGGVAATSVTFDMESRYTDGIMDSRQFASLGEQQAMQNVNVLTDANQVFTVATPFFSQQQNTAPRTITLPLEKASKGLQFMVHNLAGSTGSITFNGSAGGAALGNNVLPAGKTGTYFCDGLTWYCSISA